MKAFNILTCCIAVTAMVSCRSERYIYSSPIPNSPILENEKDASVAFHSSGRFGVNDKSKRWGGDIQLAYAATNYLGLIYSYSHRNERDIYGTNYNYPFNSSNVKYGHNNHEFGVGLFHTPNRDMTNHKGSKLQYLTNVPQFSIFSIFNNTKVGFSLYGGFGFGNTNFTDEGLSSKDSTYSRYFDSRYTKFYFQPTLNFFKSENFSFSIIGKFSKLNFNRVNSNYTLNEMNSLNLENIQDKSVGVSELFYNLTFKFNEPEWLQLQLNYGNAWSDNSYYRVRESVGSIGVYVNPFILLKKKKKKK